MARLLFIILLATLSSLSSAEQCDTLMGIATISIATHQDSSEQSLSSGSFLITRTNDLSKNLTVGFFLSGTAQPGVDFNEPAYSVSFAPGESEKSIPIAPIDDLEVEGNEDVALTVMLGLDYVLGQDITETMTLIDNDVQLNLSSGQLSFDAQQVSITSAAQTLRLSNPSPNPLIIDQLSVGVDFLIQNDQCSHQTLASKQQCSVDIVFQPVTSGVHSSRLTIPSNAIFSPHLVSLNGNGFITTYTVSSHQNASEQNQSVGSFVIQRSEEGLSNPQTIQFTLSGSAQLATDYTVSNTSISFAPGKSQHTITITPIDDIEVESSEEITLTLLQGSGDALGTPFSDTLLINDNDAQLSLSSAQLSFGSQQVSTISTAQTLLLSNSSPNPLDIGQLSISVEFALQNDQCSQQSLLAGQQCSLEIIFQPSLVGNTTGSLTIPNNTALNPQLVSVTGTSFIPSYAVISHQDASEKDQSIGSFVIQRSKGLANQQTVQFTLSGSAQLATDYTISDTSIRFSAGESQRTIVITPTDDAEVESSEEITITLLQDSGYTLGTLFSDTLLLKDNDAQLSLSSEQFSFGSQQLTTTSSAQTLLLSNSSSALLEIGQLSVSSEFLLQNDQCSQQSLLAGQQCSIEIVFQPTLPGNHTESLTIPSNATPNSNQVSLTGVAFVSPKLGKKASSPNVPITLTFTGGGKSCEFSAVQWLSPATNATIPTPPGGAKYINAFDFVDFKIDDCNIGSTINLILEFNQFLPTDAKLMKFGPTPDDLNPHWLEVESAVFGQTQVSYTITDGENGDFDLKQDGSISDPVGILIPEDVSVAAPTPPPTQDIPIRSIPTLHPATLLIMMMVLFGISARSRCQLRKI